MYICTQLHGYILTYVHSDIYSAVSLYRTHILRSHITIKAPPELMIKMPKIDCYIKVVYFEYSLIAKLQIPAMLNVYGLYRRNVPVLIIRYKSNNYWVSNHGNEFSWLIQFVTGSIK